ncbi:efflux RND transporter permease subunit [Fusobacterium ulcerans]|jgi:HAE1 family hydrophobic/amphiphilic exporter-1|uniref:CzcA family heavy metal efflux pump n=1 Tax=Fusobacterium ulcerans 12-1B TaxID=457404 RepID=H1PUW1_9FUSO|nr:efflux RND transporter permease subunit [Fusobacterium ulcerans]EHO80158.1 CzcA family heavy metal efflux pump [Fusobacterium ulcerans 12-1B]MCB8566716.1 efflux RND transporter permease subunit [Fusobacterium ulcerans]MCB8650915.1 efflux RND transporter permease subunit [Fusobacterium ulcerans]MEE0139507.1 efflux RND transporter permease subunit [Fusobacterium ulcerans]
MKSISEFSIRKPATATMFIISMIFFGILGLKKMPIEMLPNINKPTVRIRIKWDGATPSDVDKMITRKIEDVLPNVEGIVEYTSESSAEQSLIFVKFKYGTEVETKITLIQNEINQIRNKFPDDMKEPSIRKSSMSDVPAITFSMAGGDRMEMRSYAENNLKPMLERLSGVAQIQVFGGQEQEVSVEVDPNKLENYNLGIMDVYNKMNKASVNLPGGILREGEKEYLIKIEAEIETADQIKEIVLSNKDGHLLKLKDIAKIQVAPKDRTSIYRKNGKDSIVVIVSKTDDGNSVSIVNETKKVIERNRGSLPINTVLNYEFDSSVTILNSISNVKSSGLQGLVLASVILFVFLKSISATLIIAVAIPISIIFTFFLLNIQGISINLISLMGLSLGIGMLVDNSVVVVDNIFRHMTELGKTKLQAARDGAEEMALPVLASTMTTVAAFLPLVFQEGLAKEQFNNLCYAISYSLLASLVISLTFVPMIASKVMDSKKDLNAEGKMMIGFRKIYVSTLKWAIRHRGAVLGILAVLFAGSMFVASKIGGRYIPTVDEGRYAVVAKLPSGADVNKADRIGKILEEKAVTLPFVRDYTVSGNSSHAILNINAGLKTSRDLSLQEIIRELRKTFVEFPDVELTITPGYKFGTRGIYDLEFELYSDNESQLQIISQELKERVKAIDGIYDVTSSFEGGKPEGKFYIDREKAEYYGLDAKTIATMIQTQILGGTPIKINSDNSEIDVTLQLQKKYRESTGLILDSRITLPNGGNIRISDVAEFRAEEGPSKIEKKDKKKKIVIYANLKDELDLATAQKYVTATLEEMGYPDGLTYGTGGKSADMAEMENQLKATFAIAVFLIYFILVWQFESFIMPFVIILSIPLSTTGAFYALYAAGLSIDAMVSVGFVMLAGIVVNNAIVLIDFINIRRAAGDNMNKALITAGKTRLRPIMMTTLTTVLGMVPLMFSNGEGSEIYKGMSFVVVFGLSTATLLTLVVIPVFYYLIDDFIIIMKKFRKKLSKKS